MRNLPILKTSILALGVLLAAGCGGRKNNGADAGGLNTAITVTPAHALVSVGESRTFAAQGIFDSGYAWSVVPASLGTVTAGGVFTAKAPGEGVIVATAIKDSRYVGSTPITTVAAPATQVTAPAFASVNATSLVASVPAQAGCTYAWTITGGTIQGATDARQISFTAPATVGSVVVTCTVTNAASTSKQGSATIEVVDLPRIASFTGMPVIVPAGGTTYLTAFFQGGTAVVMPGGIQLQSGVPTRVDGLSATTAFSLVVSNPAGTRAAAQATVLVGDPNPPGPGITPGTTWTDPATGIPMIWCPAGTYDMGAPAGDPDAAVHEGPVHTVTFSEGFWISATKITQAQWTALMGSNPSFFQEAQPCAQFGQYVLRPVEQVSWEDAQAFLAALNAKVGWSAYRLPSEAEWEYAYRAGTSTRFYWGNDPTLQGAGFNAWFKPNTFQVTQPVAQLPGNPWKLLDMAGDVQEWVADAYLPDYDRAPTDGTPVMNEGTLFRGVRGSAWNDAAADLRASARRALPGSHAFRTLGLRVARPHRDAPVLSPLHASLTSLPAGGGAVTLTWSASGATSLVMDQGVGDVTGAGSRTVQVTRTTTFSLVARNAHGWMMSTVRVTVAP